MLLLLHRDFIQFYTIDLYGTEICHDQDAENQGNILKVKVMDAECFKTLWDFVNINWSILTNSC